MISTKQAEKILSQALSQGGQWADLFVEESIKNQASLSDKAVKTVSQNQVLGAGLRVVSNLKEYYGHTNDLSEAGLSKLAKALASSVASGEVTKKISLDSSSEKPQLHDPAKAPSQVGWKPKIALLRQADQVARAFSDKIVQVNASYMDETQRIVVANSDGLYKDESRTRGRFALQTVAASGEVKEFGYESPGALKGFEFFEHLNIPELAHHSAETAVRMLTAPHAPQGPMTVIIDGGFGGVIFHEACGHSLEAHAVARKATVMAAKLNHRIASDCVSAVDDGTLLQEWGSTVIDDEGETTRRNLLIDQGVLKSFLVDRLNGERLGLKSTGSSRRESYRYAPTSRMNNTFILPGHSSLESMIAETDYGLYAKKMGGGSVNPATGEFNFAVMEGYLIEHGKITRPVKGATLIGRGEEILKKIDRVGDTLSMAQGMCGASSGWVPVNVGQPPIRVRDLLVGGQA
ncbi:MAG: TldD/PmbA family protein [Deltaproteobacteria bacterium]|nr:TldD/PmbA family protein [Deltaproteobacteria bacterium]